MTYYVNTNTRGVIIGFYSDEINPIIPDSAIAISNEQWQAISSEPEKWLFSNGEFVKALPLQPQINVYPNWQQFTIDMFGNSGYQLIRISTSNQIAAQQLEVSTMGISNGFPFVPKVYFPLWDAVIAGLAEPPTLKMVGDWTVIAASNNMPFTYTDDGLMIQVNQELSEN